MVVVTGAGITMMQLLVIKSAIGLYLKTGMKANHAYTPANMCAVVSKNTGKQYARGRKGLEAALTDLTAHIEQLKTSQVSHNPTERSDEAQSSTATIIEQQNR